MSYMVVSFHLLEHALISRKRLRQWSVDEFANKRRSRSWPEKRLLSAYKWYQRATRGDKVRGMTSDLYSRYSRNQKMLLFANKKRMKSAWEKQICSRVTWRWLSQLEFKFELYSSSNDYSAVFADGPVRTGPMVPKWGLVPNLGPVPGPVPQSYPKTNTFSVYWK